MLWISLAMLASQVSGAQEGAPSLPTDRTERVEAVFNALSADTMDLLSQFYAEDIVFEDPLGRREGLDELRAYYAHLYASVTAISFDFSEHVAEGDTHVAMWTMTLDTKKYDGEDAIQLEGNSVIRFDEAGRVEYHRDYFDMGAFIYKRVPVIGWLVRKVDKRLEPEDGD